MGTATIDVLLMHCLQWTSHVSVHANLKVPNITRGSPRSRRVNLKVPIDYWYESFNEKEKVGACFLDISKCFDCIDHERLLSKLNKYGILNTELKWFSSFLSGRKQAV